MSWRRIWFWASDAELRFFLFVIPARSFTTAELVKLESSSWLCLVLLSGSGASSRLRRAGYFQCRASAQLRCAGYFCHCAKVTKTLGTGRGAPPRIMRGGVYLCFSAPAGSSGSTSVYCQTTRAHRARAPAGIFRRRLRCSAPRTAPRSMNPCIPALPRGIVQASGSFCGRMPPKRGPLWRGERAEEKSAGGRTRCAPVRRMYTDVHPAIPVARSRTRRAGCLESASPGVCFFGYLSLHKHCAAGAARTAELAA